MRKLSFLLIITLSWAVPAQDSPIAVTVEDIENGLDRVVGRGPGGIVKDLPTVSAPVQFDANQATIRYESKAILDAYGQALQGERLQKAVIAVAGHTDDAGSETTNLLLSHRRAHAVRDYLMNNYGIKAYRLRVEAYGETQPAASNTTVEGKARNRRVEFIRLGWVE